MFKKSSFKVLGLLATLALAIVLSVMATVDHRVMEIRR